MTGFAFTQPIETTFTFLDSAATTGSYLLPYGYYPVAVTTGDLNKIATFAINYSYDNATWYGLALPGGSAAVTFAVRDNCIVQIPVDYTVGMRGRGNDSGASTNKKIYVRLDPNDSDTTSRTWTLTIDNIVR